MRAAGGLATREKYPSALFTKALQRSKVSARLGKFGAGRLLRRGQDEG
jgi:hypothetical protein